jgi:copper chaperone CopZ
LFQFLGVSNGFELHFQANGINKEKLFHFHEVNQMKTLTFNVKGMHCTSCEMLITDSLSEMAGIKKAEASHKKGVVKVEFDESKVKAPDIKKIIAAEGYEVQ